MKMKEFYEMAYEECLTDLMMELCICEKEAKGRLDKILEDNPNYLKERVKFIFGRECI
jgi:hypothetical protein